MSRKLLSAGIILSAAVIAFSAGVHLPTPNERFSESSEAWCDQQDGDLLQVHAFWDGGLHCQLPGGQMKKMSEVPEEERLAALNETRSTHHRSIEAVGDY